MSADDSLGELPAVADEPTVVVCRVVPVGTLHQFGVEAVDAAGVAERGLADRLAVNGFAEAAHRRAAADWPATLPMVTQLP